MTTDTKAAAISATNKGLSFIRRLGLVLWRLIRIIFVSVVLGGVIASFIWFTTEVIVEPLNDARGRIAALEEELQSERNNVTDELSKRDTRITALERTLTEQDATLNSFSALTSDVEALQKELSEATSTIQTLKKQSTALQSDLRSLNQRSQSLELSSNEQQEELATLSSDFSKLQEQSEDTAHTLTLLEEEALLLHAQANVLNAQREISQQDIGSAIEYLKHAELSIKAVATLVDESQEAPVAIVLTRIVLALEQLENDPFTASADLESLWRAMDSVILGTLSVKPLELPLEEGQENDKSQDADEGDGRNESEETEASEEDG